MISRFILVTGFIVILLGVLLIATLVFTRRKRNELFMKQKDLTALFQDQLLQAQVEVQENTFQHIGKELHDNVGQLLSTTKMLIGITEKKMDTIPDTLATAHATLSQAIQEVRLLSRSLDKEWLEQFSFMDNLHTEADRINAGGAIGVSIDCDTTISMKADAQIILFRIVQEAIQNALRHAQPDRIHVRISRQGSALELQVSNNGKPLPPIFNGMGTANMRHRASLFGGSVQWSSADGQTIVRILIPLNDDQ